MSSTSNETTNDDLDLGINNPALDDWESQKNGFLSMRRAYELHTYYGLESGLTPNVEDIRAYRDRLRTLHLGDTPNNAADFNNFVDIYDVFN